MYEASRYGNQERVSDQDEMESAGSSPERIDALEHPHAFPCKANPGCTMHGNRGSQQMGGNKSLGKKKPLK